MLPPDCLGDDLIEALVKQNIFRIEIHRLHLISSIEVDFLIPAGKYLKAGIAGIPPRQSISPHKRRVIFPRREAALQQFPIDTVLLAQALHQEIPLSGITLSQHLLHAV